MMDENDPIYMAIDRGGGQTCDIEGVVRELKAAGYVIVPRVPTDAMVSAAFKDADAEGNLETVWEVMIAALDEPT